MLTACKRGHLILGLSGGEVLSISKAGVRALAGSERSIDLWVGSTCLEMKLRQPWLELLNIGSQSFTIFSNLQDVKLKVTAAKFKGKGFIYHRALSMARAD